MEDSKVKGATLDEAVTGVEHAEQQPVDQKWVKLVTRIGNHPKGKNMILLPEDVVLLRTKMGAMTRQLLQLTGFVQTYGPAMQAAAQTAGSFNDTADLGGDGEGGGGVRPDAEVDPEDLHNTLTSERPGPVAGNSRRSAHPGFSDG